ncbi:MAG: type II toxin-antitoxin system RelE/ParE family toxin [Deltaproteobacteria bacterium]|nr:type II toxin-antitoxin system RelE/ParE family toxin [Deltaproteobacteria bacterium]MBI2974485.1 type II toxin-antitoxin system RelE/ParE family toxin [Deltaproteobacteria bacterium]
MKITFYQTSSGRSPVLDYVRSLQNAERAHILAVLSDIEQFGFETNRATFRQIDGKLWEIKISHNRIFYVIVEHGEMVLLHAYKKQNQKLPLRERDVAIKRMKEVLL